MIAFTSLCHLYLTEQNAATTCHAWEACSNSPSEITLLVEVTDCLDDILPVSTKRLLNEKKLIRQLPLRSHWTQARLPGPRDW